jgi:hypothetical protein
MALAEYPTPSVNSSYPDPLVSYKMPDKFQVDSTTFDDGGVDTALRSGGNGIQRWYLFYDGLTAVQAAILDSHMATAKLPEGDGPSAFSFNYRDVDSAILYSGVRYQSYDRPIHKNKDIMQRTVLLVKYP